MGAAAEVAGLVGSAGVQPSDVAAVGRQTCLYIMRSDVARCCRLVRLPYDTLVAARSIWPGLEGPSNTGELCSLAYALRCPEH